MSDIDGSPVSQFASRTKKPGYMGPGLQIQNQERARHGLSGAEGMADRANPADARR